MRNVAPSQKGKYKVVSKPNSKYRFRIKLVFFFGSGLFKVTRIWIRGKTGFGSGSFIHQKTPITLIFELYKMV